MAKPLLLHACCAPCSIAIIDELKNQYDLTVLFFNPNIFPQSEYEKRKAEVIRVCNEWNACHSAYICHSERSEESTSHPCHSEHSEESLAHPCHSEHSEESFHQIKFIDLDYSHENWKQAVKGLESEPEAGKRCAVCFTARLRKTAEYAKENGVQIFASSLTSGRNKKTEVIGEIGRRLANELGLEFLDENWKSKGRQEKGQKLTSERGIYRQNYCGCEYSLPSPF